MSEEIEVYIKIASALTPLIGTALVILFKYHFDLKQDVNGLSIRLENNNEADKAREGSFDKLWIAIDQINVTLKNLEVDVRVLTEKINGSGQGNNT